MSNILINPSSGILEFNTGAASGSAFDQSMSGASRFQFRNSGELNLTSYGTGVADKFTIDGSNGRLFSVDNTLTGNIFSVNDAAGLPILEVTSTSGFDKVTIGEYATDALVVSGSSVSFANLPTISGHSFITGFSEGDDLQTVTDRGDTTTTSILSTGPHISGVTGLFGERVGIGTDAPSKKLTVISDDNLGPTKIISAYANNEGQHTSLCYGSVVGSYELGLFTLTTQPITFRPNSVERMRVTNDGFVGIGTTAPSGLVHATGIGAPDTTNYGIISDVDGGSNSTNIAGYFSATSASDNIALKTVGRHMFGGNIRVTEGYIDQRSDRDSQMGNIFVGDTTAGYIAGNGGTIVFAGDSVAQGIANSTFASIRGIKENGSYNTSLGALVFGTQDDAGSSQQLDSVSEKMRITSDGYVGIGTGDPYDILEVYKAADPKIILSDANSFKIALTTDGTNGAIQSLNSSYATHKTPISFDLNTAALTTQALNVTSATSTTVLTMGNNSHRIYSEPNDFAIVQTTSSYKAFRLLGNVPAETLVLESNGYVGVGTSAPLTRLDVRGTISGSGDFLGTGVGNRITLNGTGYLLSGDSPAETQTLQQVTDRGSTTTNSITSSGPHISGVKGLFSDKVGIGGTGAPTTHLSVINNTPGSNVLANFGATTMDGATRNGGLQINQTDSQGDKTWGIWGKGLGSYNGALKFTYLGTRATSLSAGTDILTLDSAGFVGIGTSVPAEELHVSGSSTTTVRVDGSAVNLEIQSEGSTRASVGTITDHPLRLVSNDTERLTILGDGKVGIGTDSPDQNLVVFAEGNVGAKIKHANVGWLQFENTNGNYWHIEHDYGDNDLRFGRSVSHGLLTLTEGSLVGIGTVSPSGRLHVWTATAGVGTPTNTSHDDLIIENNTHCGIQLSSPASSYQYLAFGDEVSANQGYVRYYHGDDRMDLRAGGTDTLTIRGGNVGIGTTDPSSKLHIVGEVWSINNGANTRYLLGDNTSNGNWGGLRWDSTNDYLQIIDSNYSTTEGAINIRGSEGRVGIGTNNPAETLHVDGNILIPQNKTLQGYYGGSIPHPIIGMSSTIDTIIYASGNNSSDIFFKTNSAGTLDTRMTILNAGKVGIGTDAPDELLHISGASASLRVDSRSDGATLILNDVDGVTGMWAIKNRNGDSRLGFSRSDGGGTDLVSFDLNGNVGIGTVSPNALLEINDNIPRFSLYDTATSKRWEINKQYGGLNFAEIGAADLRLFLKDGGGVGIGVDPTEDFEVFQAGKFKVDASDSPIVYITNNSATSSTNGTATLKFQQGNTQDGGSIIGGRDGNYSDGASRDSYMAFLTATNATDSEKMRITTDGNVGIGTDAPARRFDVSTNASDTYGIRNSYNASYYMEMAHNRFNAVGSNYIRFNIADDPKMTIVSSATYGVNGVGIGTVSPTTELQVMGTISGSGDFLGTGAGNRITNNGTPYLLSGDAASALTLQDVCDNDNSTTTSILSTGPHISGVTGLFSHAVGIGTGDPTGVFEIVTSDEGARNTNEDALVLTRRAAGSYPYYPFGNSILFRGETYRTNSIAATYLPHARIKTQLRDSSLSTEGVDMSFELMATDTDATPTERMRITSTGYVGIGLTDPDANLHIYQDSPSANQVLFQIGTSDDETRLTVDEDGDMSLDGQLSVAGPIVTKGNIISSYDSADELAIQVGGDTIFKSWQSSVGWTETVRIEGYADGGYVGIGTSAPAEKLEVSGNIRISDGKSLKLYSSSNIYNGSIYKDSYNGTIDIGNQTNIKVSSVLEIDSDAGDIQLGQSSTYSYSRVAIWPRLANKFAVYAGVSDLNGISGAGFGFYNQGSAGKMLAIVPHSMDDTEGAFKFQTMSGSSVIEAARFSIDGRFGIGTNAPSYKLDVGGDVGGTGVGDRITLNGTPYLLSGDAASALTLQDVCDNDNSTTTSILSTGPHISGVTGLFSDAVCIGTDAPNAGIGLQVNNGAFYVYNGNAKLDEIDAGYFAASRDLVLKAGTAAAVQLQAGSTKILTAKYDGTVGIGTDSPTELLHVSGGILLAEKNDAAETWHNIIVADNSASGVGTHAGIGFNAQGWTNDIAKAGIFQKREGSYGRGSLYFVNNNDSTWTSATEADAAITIDPDRNVGIGTTDPEELLHVKVGDGATGTIKIEGGLISSSTAGEINAKLDFGSNETSVDNVGNIGGRIASITEYNNGARVGMAFSTFDRDGDKLKEGLRIGYGGNVGVGTTNPSVLFEVNDTGASDNKCIAKFEGQGLAASTDDGGQYISITRTGPISHTYGIMGGIYFGGTNVTSAGAMVRADYQYLNGRDLQFLTSTGNTSSPELHMVVKGDGKVGIGTDDPAVALEVHGEITADGGGSINGTPTNAINALDSLGVGLWSAAGVQQFQMGAGGGFSYLDMRVAGDMIFRMNGNSEAMRILEDGKVGIGTTTPSARLDIVGNSDTVPAFKMGSNANHGFSFYERATEGDLRITKEVGGAEVDVINIARSDGDVGFYQNVGIGTTAPAYKLHVNSTTNDEVARFQSTDRDAFISIADYKKTGYIGIDGDLEVLSLGFNANMGLTSNVNITTGGWIGIGDVTPISELNILPETASITIGGLNTKGASLDTTWGQWDAAGDIVGSYHGQTSILSTNGSPSLRGFWVNHTSSYAENGVTWSGPSLIGFYSEQHINTASHRGTIANQYGFRASAGINSCGVGGAVTNAYGVYIELVNNDSDGTVTNSYGVYIDDTDTAGASTNRYGIYSKGSATKNYFEGSVGIGTTAPSETLDVKGTANIGTTSAGGSLQLEGKGGLSYGWKLRTDTYNGLLFQTNTYNKVIFSYEGNVGIGTTAPLAMLDVRGDISGSGSFLGTGIGNRITNNGTPYLLSGDSPAETQTLQQVCDKGSTTTTSVTISDDLIVDTDTLFVDASTDRVGIGTSAPDAMLHISGGSALIQGISQSYAKFYHSVSASDYVSTSANVFALNSYYATNEYGIYVNNAGNFSIAKSGSANALVISNNHITMTGSNLKFESIQSTTSPAINLRGAENGDEVGIYSPATNKFSIVTDRTDRVVVDAVGSVGIGTTAPNGALHVNVENNRQLLFTRSATGPTATDGTYMGQNGTDFAIINQEGGSLTLGTSNTDRLTIEAGGDVGIGTTNPTTPLHVKYAAAQDSFEVGIKVENTVGDSKLRIEGTNNETQGAYGRGGAGIDLRNLDTTAGNYSNINFYNGAGYGFAGLFGVCTVTGASNYTEGKLEFYTRNATDNYFLGMTLDESGRLGIGSASPAALLDVDGTATFDEVGIGTADPAAALTVEVNAAVDNPGTDSNCTVLIENTHSAGSAILRMRGGDGAARLMYGENNSTDKLYISPRNSTTTQVVVDHIGRMGIGTATPTKELHVQGAAYATGAVIGDAYVSAAPPTNGLIVQGDVGIGIYYAGSSQLSVYENASIGAGYYGSAAPSNGLLVQGNVGIGTSNPSTELHVDGTITCDDGITTITPLTSDTSTAYTLVIGDQGNMVSLSNASAVTLTIPANSAVAFPIGTEISAFQAGAGQVTIAGAGGVTVNAADAELKTRVQYSSATLYKTASDTWLVVGDLTA